MIENKEYFEMIVRVLRAGARRIASSGNSEELIYLREIEQELDQAYKTAVLGLRKEGHSWDYIAHGLGTSRQNVYQRFAKYTNGEIHRDLVKIMLGP